MEDKLYYLIKDVGIPTALCAMMAFGWYKLGIRVLDTLGKNNEIIKNNTLILTKVIDLLDKRIR